MMMTMLMMVMMVVMMVTMVVMVVVMMLMMVVVMLIMVVRCLGGLARSKAPPHRLLKGETLDGCSQWSSCS